jgi:enoyl-CoA hydratase/carnithine racemase
MAVPCLALGAAIERLASPIAEECSVLTGVPVLAMDARGGERVPAAEVVATAIQRLATLPCPAVVLTAAEVAPAMRRFVAVCDVVVRDQAELDAIVAAVVASPIAAATLVQVLRGSETRPVADGLPLESLAYATLQAGPEHARWLAARGPRAAAVAEPGPAVAVDRTAAAWRITLQRPARHNAFSARMRDDLCDALALALADPLPVELRGAGASFSSGGDLDEFGTLVDPATAHLVRTTRSPARALAALAARTHAVVQGACIGAGIELAAFASRVTVTPDAFFQLPEIAMGLIPGAGGTVSLPRRIGRQRTAQLALGGRRLDATTARAWGLVDAIDEAIADRGDCS